MFLDTPTLEVMHLFQCFGLSNDDNFQVSNKSENNIKVTYVPLYKVYVSAKDLNLHSEFSADLK